ncbi:unnamed protein product [Prorocentrum cordatum]|uniref:Uncharacterized protein n=1 Tax=Prorocentrum cordatum TaxID=2364126 RepID=A0ABN9U407_9DINO|nr:unnamed protein product [Polarella glacialis]
MTTACCCHSGGCGLEIGGEQLKSLVSACILVIATRMELGVGMREVARSAGLQAGDVSKALWKVCKVCGLRLRRTRRQSLEQRAGAPRQRGLLCRTASRGGAGVDPRMDSDSPDWCHGTAACSVSVL